MIPKKKLWVIFVVCIVLMLLFEALIQVESNIRASRKTTDLMLEKIVEIARKNDIADENLETSLKDEYIIRAKSVAYVTSKIPGVAQDLGELQRIARMLAVDEIHFFNPEGRIYGGTEPKYYDMTMEDGEQIGFFKPMLQDYNLTMCQNLIPNTAEGRSMMYAMVWNEEHTALVQVGIEPVRLLQEINSHDLPRYIDAIPVTEGESVYIADPNSGVIYGSTVPDTIGSTLREIGFKMDLHNLKEVTVEYVNGTYITSKFVPYREYIIGVGYDLHLINQGISVSMCIGLAYLTLAAFIISRYVGRVEKITQEKTVLRETSLRDELTRLYNKRAYVRDRQRILENGLPGDFLLISMDLNGLKNINDNLGHAAGDELIQGAADCMNKILGRFGRIYRTGGDEYVAILQVPNDGIAGLLADFREAAGSWKGELCGSMSISIGSVSAEEARDMTFPEIEKLADDRMYEVKRAYYAQKGNDRRRT